VSDLPWEVVMEFREHDAAGEARARLQDAVERVQRDGITAADNQLTRDMIFADKDLRKRHSLKERTKMAVSVVPVAGGALTEGAGAAADAARGKHDWVAALRLLRRVALSRTRGQVARNGQLPVFDTGTAAVTRGVSEWS
jgi:hypothetical protein